MKLLSLQLLVIQQTVTECYYVPNRAQAAGSAAASQNPDLRIIHFRLSYENVPIVSHVVNAVNVYCSDRIIWRLSCELLN